MNWNAKFEIKVANFFRKNGRIILIIAVIWILLIFVNNWLANRPEEEKNLTAYDADDTIMDFSGSVPNAYKEKVKQTIDDFFNYCNDKEYEKAYNMLTDAAKSYLYDDSLETFKKYVDLTFDKKKIYTLQNYSNATNMYMYTIKINDDLETTGATGGYDSYEEKWIVERTNGEYYISNQGYIGRNYTTYVAEDEYMKVEITSIDIGYSKKAYNMTIRNKSDYYIVLYNGELSSEIVLQVNDTTRASVNTAGSTYVLLPETTNEVELIFESFYDESETIQSLRFNAVRLLEDASHGFDEINDYIYKTYSFNINL